MFVAGAIKRIYGFCIESVVSLFVHRLIVSFRDFGKRIRLLLCVQTSSEQTRVHASQFQSSRTDKENNHWWIFYYYLNNAFKLRDIEDITRWREDMNFMFEWQKRYLTSERSKRVRCRFCHENIKLISLSQHVKYFLLYGDQM